MDTEVNPATTAATPVPTPEAPNKIQEYKAKIDTISKEANLFLQSTLVCTKCGSNDIGTEIRIMEGGSVAPAQEPTLTPADPSPAEVVEAETTPAEEVTPS